MLDGITDKDLAGYFVDIGEVHSAQLRGNDGGHYGFMEFADPAVAEQVLSLAEQQPFMMGDQYLRVQLHRPKHQNQVSFSNILSHKDVSPFWCNIKQSGVL